MRIDPITTAKLTLFSDEKKTLENANSILWDLHLEMTKKGLVTIQNCEGEWFTADNLHYVSALLDFLTENADLELTSTP